MLNFEIRIGAAFVNDSKRLVRVVKNIINGLIYCWEFNLVDGQPLESHCHREELFRNWVDRPATNEERRRLRQDLASDIDVEYMRSLIYSLPNYIIDGEFDRRDMLPRKLDVLLSKEHTARVVLLKIPDALIEEEYRHRGLGVATVTSGDQGDQSRDPELDSHAKRPGRSRKKPRA